MNAKLLIRHLRFALAVRHKRHQWLSTRYAFTSDSAKARREARRTIKHLRECRALSEREYLLAALDDARGHGEWANVAKFATELQRIARPKSESAFNETRSWGGMQR